MDRALSDSVKRKRKRKLITRVTIVCLVCFILIVLLRSVIKPSIQVKDFYTERTKKSNIQASVSASGTVVPEFKEIITSPISTDIQKNLFTPFFTTKKTGQGIGLTLIREILVNHGCKFSLQTGSEGITGFKILFKKG